MSMICRNTSPYNTMLIGRARAWGVVCMAAGAGADASVGQMVGRHGDAADVDRLVSRLESMGLAVREDDTVRLTARGLGAVADWRETGTVPRVVQDDPADWRQRAWWSMRIRTRFTAADVTAAADAPSANAVQRYCRELVEAGVLRPTGIEVRGRYDRWMGYVVICDDGPVAPRLAGPERSRETDEARPWRRRAWSALWRMGAAGLQVVAADVAVASRVPHWRAATLLVALYETGALARERRGLAGGGWQWAYALATGARDAAEPVLRASDEAEGRAPWRETVWSALVATGTLTAIEAAEIGGVARGTAYRLLDAACQAGHVRAVETESDATGPGPLAYVVTDACPEALPALVLRRPSARPEVAVSDG